MFKHAILKITFKPSFILSLLFFFLMHSLAFAQVSRIQNGVGKNIAGKITGRIQDKKTGEGVEFVTISIIKTSDSSIVTGAQTDKKGFFIIENMYKGQYKLKANFLGYRPYESGNFLLTPEKFEIYLGIIKLESNTEVLNEVAVTGEKGVFQMGIDKKVFNVDQNIVTSGGSAGDVLQNIPSLSVDIDGNVSLRGSENITILIDGKPSGLTSKAAVLEQISASAIQSIELITNPSAKYDADGMAGIINIVLKKNRVGGINGNASLSIGTRNKYGAAAGINYRNEKINLSANYNYRNNERFGRGKSFRTSFADDSISFLDQQTNSDNGNANHSFKIANDFYLPRKSTISISVSPSFRKEDATSTINSRFLTNIYSTESAYDRINNETEEGKNIDATIGYKKIFLKPKQELSADITYSTGDFTDINLYTNVFLITDFKPDNINSRFEKITNSGYNRLFSVQSDYIQPVGKRFNLEAGLKSTLRKSDENNNAFFSTTDQNNLIEDSRLTNIFINTENIIAAYQNFAATYGKTGVQIGTRLEYTDNLLEQKRTLQTFQKKYLSFFPSLFIKQSLSKNQEIQFSYSRRISRPNSRYTNPFIDYSDPLNVRFGNPNINPEFTNAFEISYQTLVKTTSLVSSIYLRQTSDVIQSIREIKGGDTTESTFANLNKSRSTGAEFIAKTQLKNWWNVTTTLNLYQSQLTGSTNNLIIDRSNFNYSLQLMSIIKPSKDIAIQVSGNYRSESITPQSKIKNIYALDIGCKKDIFKSKGSISLNVTDIFDTRQFIFITETPTFNQNNERKRESRIATITFAYRFGKLTENPKNRSQRRGQDGQGEQMQEISE